jgi:hypothetical protein
MSSITSPSSIEKGRATSRVPSSPSDQLHQLARLIERLGVSGRTDPEQIVLGKLAIAGELRELARAIRP